MGMTSPSFRGVFHSKNEKRFSKLDNHLVFVFIFIVIPKSIPHVLEMKDLSYSLKGFLFFPFFPTTNSRKGPNFDNLLRLFFLFFSIFNFRTYKDIFNSF